MGKRSGRFGKKARSVVGEKTGVGSHVSVGTVLGAICSGEKRGSRKRFKNLHVNNFKQFAVYLSVMRFILLCSYSIRTNLLNQSCTPLIIQTDYQNRLKSLEVEVEAPP